jgi:hypothetical protein
LENALFFDELECGRRLTCIGRLLSDCMLDA